MSPAHTNRIKNWLFVPPILALLFVAIIRSAGLEASLFLWLNHQGRFVNDYLWVMLTTFGDGLVVCVLILPFLRRKPAFAWSMILAWLFMALWIKVIKNLIVTVRPLSILAPDQFHFIGVPYRFNSFPSGHAATAAIFAVTICIFYRQKWLRAGIIILALAVSFSRIAMGLHWATDVLVGFAGGWMLGLLAQRVSQRFRLGIYPAARIIFGIILSGAALGMLIRNHTDYPEAFRLLQVIALACLLFTAYDLWVALHRKEPNPATEGVTQV